MNNLLIGNIICFIGSIMMILAGLAKKKRNFLILQSSMNVIFITGNLFLGGVSGATANVITLSRNLVTLKWNLNTPMKIVFIVLQVALTFAFGVTNVIMWLPVVSVCICTLYMDTEDMAVLKTVIIFSQALWGIYDLFIKNFAAFPFDISTIITNTIALIHILKAKKVLQTDPLSVEE